MTCKAGTVCVCVCSLDSESGSVVFSLHLFSIPSWLHLSLTEYVHTHISMLSMLSMVSSCINQQQFWHLALEREEGAVLAEPPCWFSSSLHKLCLQSLRWLYQLGLSGSSSTLLISIFPPLLSLFSFNVRVHPWMCWSCHTTLFLSCRFLTSLLLLPFLNLGFLLYTEQML